MYFWVFQQALLPLASDLASPLWVFRSLLSLVIGVFYVFFQEGFFQFKVGAEFILLDYWPNEANVFDSDWFWRGSAKLSFDLSTLWVDYFFGELLP